jgi:hypothetical protein
MCFQDRSPQPRRKASTIGSETRRRVGSTSSSSGKRERQEQDAPVLRPVARRMAIPFVVARGCGCMERALLGGQLADNR